jgi:hypothetical protein
MWDTIYAVAMGSFCFFFIVLYIGLTRIQRRDYAEWLEAKKILDEGNRRFWRENPEMAQRLNIPKED